MPEDRLPEIEAWLRSYEGPEFIRADGEWLCAELRQLRAIIDQMMVTDARLQTVIAQMAASEAVSLALDCRDKAIQELERCRVQLAGCAVAALGGELESGDYGWSAALDDIRQLRAKWRDAETAKTKLIERLLEAAEILESTIASPEGWGDWKSNTLLGQAAFAVTDIYQTINEAKGA